MGRLLSITQLRHRIAQLRKKRLQILDAIRSKWIDLTQCTAAAVTAISELQRYDVLGATEDLKMNLPPLDLERQIHSEGQAVLELSLLSSPWLDSATEALLRLHAHLPEYISLVRQLRDAELLLSRFRQQLKQRLKDQAVPFQIDAENEEEQFRLRKEGKIP